MSSEDRQQLIEEVIENLKRKSSHALRFTDAFAQSLLPSAIVGIDGEWVEVNESLCSVLGYSSHELKSKTWQELTHPDYLDIDLELVRECREGQRLGYHLRKKYISKSGEVLSGHLFVTIIENRDDRFFLSQIFFPKILEELCTTGRH